VYICRFLQYSIVFKSEIYKKEKLLMLQEIKRGYTVIIYLIILYLLVPHLNYSQTLPAFTVSASSSSSSSSWTTLNDATVTADVTNVNRIFLIATFSSRTNSGNAITAYRIADEADPSTFVSGELQLSHNATFQTGSIVHIFDVGSLSGNRTYAFQQNTDAGTVNTNVTLTAIVLYDGDDQLATGQSIQTGQLASTSSFGAILTSPTVNSSGGFYVTATTNATKTSGSENTSNEWKLQFKSSSASTWTDLSLPVTVSISGTGSRIVNLAGYLPETFTGNHEFRVVHRKVSGSENYFSEKTSISVIALGTNNGIYPGTTTTNWLTSTTGTTLNSYTETRFTAGDNTNFFAHAQFGCISSGTSNSPSFDLYLDKGSTNIFNGQDVSKALAASTESGSGATSGLITGLQQDSTYTFGMRHASTSSRTLTTRSTVLSGFALKRNSVALPSPIKVTASTGLAFATFSSLQRAFEEINQGVFRGDITIRINNNLNESASCIINGSGTGNAQYNTITIFPTATGLKISGNMAAPLIDLNGADNITFDGRVNMSGAKNLIIENTNTSGNTFRFINDASANTLKYLNILGANNQATSGVILFSTGTSTGNDQNTIEYSNISDGATTPANLIYSAGLSVSTDNSNNSISNCNIFNFFSATVASAGIHIASNSSAWTITNNRFYQTATRTVTTAGTHRAINIISASGINFNISNNIIGFANENGTGRTIYQSTVALLYRAIELTAGITSTSSIQGNLISGITFSTSSGSTTLPGIFTAISTLAGNVNVGNTMGNNIGSGSGTDDIEISSTSSLGAICGIYHISTGTGIISNNIIGGFKTGGGATIGYTFNGIATAGTGGNFSITQNLIGSTTVSNSISIGTDGVTTTPVSTFRGINNAATGTISIENNTVQNCSVYGTSGAAVFNGIVSSAGSGTMNINYNNIIAARMTAAGTLVPISSSATVSVLNINNNTIKTQTRTNTAGTFTAISNNGAVLSNININNNKLGENSDPLITYSTNNSGALLGISNSAGAASCELSIQNNDFRGIVYLDAAGTNSHTYIINSAATLSQDISNNTFTNLNVKTNGAIIFISNSVSLPSNGTQTVSNNHISGSFVRSPDVTSGTLTVFTSTAATNNSGVVVNHTNNNFSNLTVSGASVINGWTHTDAGTGEPEKTVSGNTFENWTGGTGAITVMTAGIVSQNARFANNIINNISSSGTITGITAGAGNDSIYLNTISNITSTGGVAATVVSGITNTTATRRVIQQNTITGLTGNTLTTGSVRGILITAGTEIFVYKNSIGQISANANTTGTISGIWVAGGTAVVVGSNKIYDIESTSTAMSGAGCVYGVQVSGTTVNITVTIANNLISDLRTAFANSSTTLIGIGVINTGTSTVNVYYNTVYLNATSTGTNFGTSGIYHTASATASASSLNLRNNIIVNLSNPSGSGLTVAFRRSSGASGRLSNYAGTSNNNLFYSGTPGANRLIFHDGTNGAQTIANYKSFTSIAGTIAPRDQASVSENPDFLSLSPSNSDFLKINPLTPTQIESGAANITGFSTDYADVIRQGNPGYSGNSTSAPDIGAYEGDYSAIDAVAPSISYILVGNNSCLNNKIITATITDGTGVNTTTFAPRIYYKKSTNLNVLPATNDNTTNGWKFTQTSQTVSPFNFTLDYTLLQGGISAGDIIQYFIVAQDIVNPNPYIGINTGIFNTSPTSVALTSSSFPIGGTLNSFTVLQGLSGTVTIGSGGNYPALTTTDGLFADINNKGLSGNLTAIITDALINETSAIALTQIRYGCDDNYSLTIRPQDGTNAVLSGDFNGSFINLNGADFVTFDGINSGGTSLTLRNINTVTSASTILFGDDATNNTITRCFIEGSSTGLTSGTILFSTGIVTGNDGNSISNNTIRPAGSNLPFNAIYSAGSTLLVDNSGNLLSNNNIQDYYNSSGNSNGVLIASNSSGWQISGNRFYQTSARTATATGIHRAINITTTSGSGYTISNNIIGYANASGTGTTTYEGSFNQRFIGIELTAGINANSDIQGNTIADISVNNGSGTATTTAPGLFAGISVLAGRVNIGTSTGNVIGASTGTGSIAVTASVNGNFISGIYATTTSIADIRNNQIGSITAGGASNIGFVFHGISVAGGGQHIIRNNSIGSQTTAHSVRIGIQGVTTTGICTLNGISNTSTGGLTVAENLIQNTSVYGTGASVFNGILNTGLAGLIEIKDNNIIQVVNTGTTTGSSSNVTGFIRGISNTAAVTRLDITGNLIRGFVKPVDVGLVWGIFNSGAVLSEININNNLLGNNDGDFITYTAATTAMLTGISNTAGSANCALSIQNNNIQGIFHVLQSTHAHTYIINTATTLSQNISNNSFTNISVNTTGSIIFISNSVVLPANGIQNINGNNISGTFTRIAASGALTLYTNSASTGNTGVIVNNNNNNFSNISLTGAATIAGWAHTDAGAGTPAKRIQGNTFSNWTGGTGAIIAMNINISSTDNCTSNNLISNITSTGNITGIVTAGGNDSIMSNTIHSLISTGATSTIVMGVSVTTTGISKMIGGNNIYNLQANNITTGTVRGISVAGGMLNKIFNNKITQLLSESTVLSTGTVNGILVSGTATDMTNEIFNNKIGDLLVTKGSSNDVIRGISLANTGARTYNRVYHNSIYLNAPVSDGANFGSTGLFHSSSATATTSNLDLRNNIIVNISEPKGTGRTVAFRRSSGSANMLNNYNSDSNNNLFFSGIPASNRLIFTDGSALVETIDNYIGGNFTAGQVAPRDNASISELPDFISTAPASADYLKINPLKVTLIESGGTLIGGITLDFDEEIRAGNPGFPTQTNGYGNAPDIGADEFDGIRPKVIVKNSNILSNGNYANLSEAFTAINANDQELRDILVTVIETTNETAEAVLTNGLWNSLKVFPQFSGLSIQGNIAGKALIEVDGANNVTIDGRVNQTGSDVDLTIYNSSTAGSGTASIRLINSASNNNIRYCRIEGSTTGSTDGVISFAGSVSGVGNSNNIVEFCQLTNRAGSRPVNLIYSQGSASYVNTNNTIRNNRLFNFLNPALSGSAISIQAHSSDWTINANSFYETAPFTPTNGSITYHAININNSSGNNFSITGNYIGGSEPLCAGDPCLVDAGTTHQFRAIRISTGTSTTSSVQNNIIRNWDYRSSSPTPWRAIQADAGNVNIGTATANIIGSNSGTGSVKLQSYANAHSDGIYITSTGAIQVSKNNIGSITLSGNNTDISHGFTAIYKSSGAGSTTISNNIIGSTTSSGSIEINTYAETSGSGQNLIAIHSDGTGNININTNTIANLINGYKGTESSGTSAIFVTDGNSVVSKNTISNIASASDVSTVVTISGIELTNTSGENSVTENSIRDLSATNSGFSGSVAGLVFNGNTGNNSVSRNLIRGLSVHASSTSAKIYGLRIESGKTTYSNNIISLGGNTATTLYGIYETGTSGNNNHIYFNTIYLGGSPASGSTNLSYAIFSNSTANERDFRNNIFASLRSTPDGSDLHYAAWFNYSSGTNLTLDYNSYYAGGTGGVPGRYAGNNVTVLPLVTGKDDNSLITNPGFVNPGGSAAVDYKQTAGFDGFFGLGILVDYANTARGATPNMGAWEFNTNRWFGSVDTNFGNPANWSSGAVPLEEVPVVFALEPLNDCVLDTDRIIGSILNNQGDYKFVVNGKKLTIKGGIYFTDGGIIDATETGSAIIMSGEEETQTIPEDGFVNNLIPHLFIHNVYGVISESNLTINDTLALVSLNPSPTQGTLHSPNKVILLGENAVVTGDGEVSGTVKRNIFSAETSYAFTSRNNTLYFGNTGTIPTEISITNNIGSTPAWRSGGIQRYYELTQTGADSGNPVSTMITAPYLTAELNSNDENKLAFFTHQTAGPQTTELGRSAIDTDQNVIQLSYVDISVFSSTPGNSFIGFDEGEIETITWNGSAGTAWTKPGNWTPSTIPSDYMNVIVPNAGSTPNDPLLTELSTIKRLKLESGSILNSNTSSILKLKGNDDAWLNEGGTYNPSNGTVQFDGSAAVISGTTNFHHLDIPAGSTLNMANNSFIRIAGIVTKSGNWNTDYAANSTVEYNGNNQDIVVPNSSTNRYRNLILSGSGTKTLPAAALTVLGDLTVSGTAMATASGNLTIRGIFTVQTNAAFNAGSNDIAVGGNIVQNGVINASTGTFILNGLDPQTISGTAALTLNNFTIQNETGVVSNKNFSVEGVLDLQSPNPGAGSGCLHMGNFVLSLGENATTTSSGEVSGTVSRNHAFADNTAYSFGNSRTTVSFRNAGTKPDQISVKASLGTAPAWKNTAIKRIYDIVQSGGSGSFADISLKYLDSELNGNVVEKLTYWQASGFPSPLTVEWGATINKIIDHYITLNSVPTGFMGAVAGQRLITFAETAYPSLTWNGSQGITWENPYNWTPNRFPGRFSNITIPDAGTTGFDPQIPLQAEAYTMNIQAEAILETDTDATLSVFGNAGAWTNQGTFNRGNSTIIFNGDGAEISGQSSFNNLNISSDAALTPQTGAINQISGILLNTGTLNAATNANTFIFDGTDQTIIRPNGTPAGYHRLTLGGSGVKTLPATSLQVWDDLNIEGSTEVQLQSSLTIGGDLAAFSGTQFIAESNTITLGGNLQAPQGAELSVASSTFILNGTQPQTIDSISIQNLTVNNPTGVSLSENTQINVSGTIIIEENATLNIGSGRFVNANQIDNRNGTSGIYLFGSSSTTPTGTLIFQNAENNPVQGTVAMYSMAFKNNAAPEGYKYKWQFFGIPIRSIVAEPTFYGSFVRSFIPNATGSTSWQALNNSSVLSSFNGYEMTQDNPKTIHFAGTLENRNFSQELDFISGRRTPGHYIIGNSFTAAIDIREISFGTHLNASAYIYNTGSALDWENQTGDDWTPGQYVVVPQNLAGIGGIPRIIPPMQGYMVRTIENPTANTSISVPYSAVMKNSVRQRATGKEQQINKISVFSILEVKSEKGSDRLWLFTEDKCTDAFDNGWDGLKISNSATAPQLFAKTKAGNLQINSTNNIDGTILGFAAGTAKTFTITATHHNTSSIYDAIYLIDLNNDTRIDITQSGTNYQFTSKENDKENRFKVVATLKDMGNNQDDLVRIFANDGKLTIDNLTSYSGKLWLYDLKGRALRNIDLKSNSTQSETLAFPRGTYPYRVILDNGRKITGKILFE
jgi:hypothetical protein